MRAALLDLAERAGEHRRVAILGEMAELGAESDRYHREIGALLAELRFDALVAVGEAAREYMTPGVPEMRWVERADGLEDAVRPGDAVLVKGLSGGRAGRRPRPDREDRADMVRVLIAGLIAMVIAVVIGPKFIEALRARRVGQQIRAEGPAGHIVKQGTPTMGGLLILVAAVVPFLALSVYTLPGLTVLFATIGCGLIGFLDDYLKVRRRRSLGLSGRWKLLLLVAVTAGVGLTVHETGYLDTEIYFPVVDVNIDLAGSSTRSSSSSSPVRSTAST